MPTRTEPTNPFTLRYGLSSKVEADRIYNVQSAPEMGVYLDRDRGGCLPGRAQESPQKL